MRKRLTVVAAAFLLLAAPMYAVFNERNLGSTLSSLKSELKREVDKRSSKEGRLETRDRSQHSTMIKLMKDCNEMAIMLYSQNQDYTFDMTYALSEVTREYEDFQLNRMPFDEMISRLDIEVDRYARLVETLRRLPPQLKTVTDVPDSLQYHNDSIRVMTVPDALRSGRKRPESMLDSLTSRGVKSPFFLDSLGMADRDSCIRYASELLLMYSEAKEHVVKDSEHYDDVSIRLKESYDYAQNRYKTIQKKLFTQRQDSFFKILGNFRTCLNRAVEDCSAKYAARRARRERTVYASVAAGLVFTFLWQIVAIGICLAIRLKGNGLRNGIRLYIPIALVGLIVMGFRMIFVPNTLMNLIFPPLMLVFCIWQVAVWFKYAREGSQSDNYISLVSMVILISTTVMSWIGLVFLAMLVVIWWLLQIASIESILVIGMLLKRYEDKLLSRRIADAHKRASAAGIKVRKGEFIRITWLYDLVDMAAIPIISILSVVGCVWLALDVFDLTGICNTVFYTPFFDFKDGGGNEILNLNVFKIVLATSLFFVFKYAAYLVRSMYRDIRYRNLLSREGKDRIRPNEVNLTLADNVISILIWGLYVIVTVTLLRIPLGALSIVAAGLATGLGLAMKDILNNFIYGIQLMSGRLRVGDWVECDGVRGQVTAISYQSTQIETVDGAVMSFLNTALFNKNFKNLTRNNSYEFVAINVGVAYGTDVERLRALLLEELGKMNLKDGYGRDVVDRKRGITVAFNDFGDNAVDIAVKQYVIVSERAGYIAKAKELIYKLLNENGINIPFPQRDIHIISE